MNLSWETVTLILGICAGIVKYSVPVGKWLAEQIERRRAARRARAALEITHSVELHRVENESDDAAWKRMEKILQIGQSEVERLERELKSARESSSISDITKTNWYKCYRELGIKIDKLETQIAREAAHTILATFYDELKTKYDELGTKMP